MRDTPPKSESEDSGSADSDPGDKDSDADQASLGDKDSDAEQASLGDKDSDADDSGSVDSATGEPDDAEENGATPCFAGRTSQGAVQQDNTIPDDGDADSDADVDDLLVRVQPGGQASATIDPPAPSIPASSAFTGANQIPPGQIVIGKFLANGAFGQVYRGTWGDTDVALKKIDFAHARQQLELSAEEVGEALEWEVARLATTHHPNLVQFHGICHKDGAPYLVLEFCHQGSLQHALYKGAEDGGAIPASRLWQWMLEISQALAYLHEQGMLHRDLKAENVLIDQYGRAKLADLGVAQVDALLASKEASAVDQGLQDMNFTAPENVGGDRNRHSSKATDIYALGLVFWQMVSRGDRPTPWEQVHQQDPSFHAIKAGERMPIPSDCPQQFRQLIRACWRARPAGRTNIADVLRQLREMAPAMHPEHAPVGLAMHLEQVLHPRREQSRHYVPCQVTLLPIEGAIEKYWERYERHVGKGPMHNAPQALQQVLDDFLATPGGAALLLSGEGGLGKSLSTYVLAEVIEQQWWRHFADPAQYPKPRYLPLFIRSHLTGWTHAELNNACADILARHGLQPSEVTPLVFVDGYDECRIEKKEPGNLARHLGLPVGAKLIVTCRPGAVPDDQLQQRFAFEGKLQSCHYLSFNLNQLLGYLGQHLSWDDTTCRTYQARLQGAPELRAVLRNPFVLYLLWQSWETVSKRPLEQLTRADIYEGFIEHVVNSRQGLLEEAVRMQLQAGHATLAASFESFAAETALLAAEDSRITLDMKQAGKTRSPWAQIEGMVQQQARQRYQQRQASMALLSEAERKEQSRRTVLTEEDFVRLQQQKATPLLASLPLGQRADALEFIHKSVFDYCLAQRLMDLLTRDDKRLTEQALQSMLDWIQKSAPKALMMLHARLEAGQAQPATNQLMPTARHERIKMQLLGAIATVLMERERYKDALEYSKKTLALEAAVPGGGDGVSDSYARIGRIYKAQGKYDDALQAYRAALKIRQSSAVFNPSSIAECCNLIGMILREQGKLDEALQFYFMALQLREQTPGGDEIVTSAVYNNISVVLYAQHKPSEALEYIRKVLDIRERVLGTEHQTTAMTYNNYAMQLSAQGRYEEALKYLYKAGDIREKVLGTDHSATAETYNNIGMVLKAQSKHVEALKWFFDALVIQEKVLGADHVMTAITYNNIGAQHSAQANHEQALKYYRMALDIREAKLGVRHTATGQSYNNVAAVLGGQGKRAEALALYHKALDIREAAFGINHSLTADCYHNIGVLMLAQGQHKDALKSLRTALAIRKKVLGVQDIATATSCAGVGEALQALGKNKEAHAHYEEALGIAVALNKTKSQAKWQRLIATLPEARADAGDEDIGENAVDHVESDNKKSGRKKARQTKSPSRENAGHKNSGSKGSGHKDSDKCLVS